MDRQKKDVFQANWLGVKMLASKQTLNMGSNSKSSLLVHGILLDPYLFSCSQETYLSYGVVCCQAQRIFLSQYTKKLLQVLNQGPWVWICFCYGIWKN